MTGVDAAIQTLQQTQVQFSLMADAKANIMITVCSLVLAVGFAQLFRSSLLLPLIGLGVFTFLALVMAILWVLPSSTVSIDGARLQQSSNPRSIFFFGNFFRMPADQFAQEMRKRLYEGNSADSRHLHPGGSAREEEVPFLALELPAVSARSGDGCNAHRCPGLFPAGPLLALKH